MNYNDRSIREENKKRVDRARIELRINEHLPNIKEVGQGLYDLDGIENLFDYYGMPFNNDVISDLYTNKWNRTYKIDYTFTRTINGKDLLEAIYQFIGLFNSVTYDKIFNYTSIDGFRYRKECFRGDFNSEKQEEFKNILIEIFNLNCSTRLSLKKVISKSKDDLKKQVNEWNTPHFETEFNNLMDCLTEKTYDKSVYLSNDLSQFLSMSFGDTWNSCQCLDGDFSGGNIGLYMDNVTWVIFRPSKNDDSNLRKAFRFLCHATDNVITFNRLYGFLSQDEKKAIEQEVVKFFSTVNNVEYPNTILSSNFRRFFRQDTNYTGYLDLSRSEYNYYYNDYEPLEKPIIGFSPICPVCGDKHDRAKLLCSSCDGTTICCECNEEVNSNYTITFNDNVYCEYCYNDMFGTCDSCGEIHLRSDLVYTSDGDYVCETCIDDYYFYCSGCEAVTPISNSDSIIVDGQCYCSNCFEYL